MASRNQPSLFDDLATLPPPATELVELGRRVPAAIKFGTSTWTYDGWAGDVYHRSYRGAQPARRLEEYARYPLFRTVGIDSAYYEPPEEPVRAAEWRTSSIRGPRCPRSASSSSCRGPSRRPSPSRGRCSDRDAATPTR